MSSLASLQLSTSRVVSSLAETGGDLHSNTLNLPSSGAGFQASQHPGTRPNDLGRTSIIVPSFVNTFSLPSISPLLSVHVIDRFCSTWCLHSERSSSAGVTADLDPAENNCSFD